MSITISVSDEVANELSERKEQDDSHNDVIQRLLDDRQTTDEPDRDMVEDTGEASLADIVDTVADDELPGSGAKLEARREALHAVVEYLQTEGTASRADFTEDVYPDHKAGYTNGEDPAYSWWSNAMCPALGTVAERSGDIQKADTSGDWS